MAIQLKMAEFSLNNQFALFLTFILTLFLLRVCLAEDSCGRGTFMYIEVQGRDKTCVPCPHNKYMDETNHSHEKCKPCPSQGNKKCRLHGKVNNLIDVCDQGQYMYLHGSTSECKPCDNGTYMNDRQHTHNRCFDCAKLPCIGSNPYIGKDCDKTSDALCCPYPNMTWTTECSTGLKCINASSPSCPPGEYLSPSHECLPCPPTEIESYKLIQRSTDITAIPAASQTAERRTTNGSGMLLSMMFLTSCIVSFFGP